MEPRVGFQHAGGSDSGRGLQNRNRAGHRTNWGRGKIEFTAPAVVWDARKIFFHLPAATFFTLSLEYVYPPPFFLAFWKFFFFFGSRNFEQRALLLLFFRGRKLCEKLLPGRAFSEVTLRKLEQKKGTTALSLSLFHKKKKELRLLFQTIAERG